MRPATSANDWTRTAPAFSPTVNASCFARPFVERGTNWTELKLGARPIECAHKGPQSFLGRRAHGRDDAGHSHRRLTLDRCLVQASPAKPAT